MMKKIICFFVIYAQVGCSNKENARLRLKEVRHSLDSIYNIGFTEQHMTQQRYDSLLNLYIKPLEAERDSLYKVLDTVVGLKHDD